MFYILPKYDITEFNLRHNLISFYQSLILKSIKGWKNQPEVIAFDVCAATYFGSNDHRFFVINFALFKDGTCS